MDRFDRRGNLCNVAPENLFWNGIGGSVAESVGTGKMVFNEGLGKGEVIGDKYERTVSECAGRESIDDRYHISIVHSSPVFDRSNGVFIRQTIAWNTLIAVFKYFEGVLPSSRLRQYILPFLLDVAL